MCPEILVHALVLGQGKLDKLTPYFSVQSWYNHVPCSRVCFCGYDIQRILHIPPSLDAKFSPRFKCCREALHFNMESHEARWRSLRISYFGKIVLLDLPISYSL